MSLHSSATRTLGHKEMSGLLFFRRDASKIARKHLERLFEACPDAQRIIALGNKLRRVVAGSRSKEAMRRRIEEVRALEGMSSFIGGLERDVEAAMNGVASEYSNGVLEASVNKTKLAKRTMYGRCSFETLRAKVLLNEELNQ